MVDMDDVVDGHLFRGENAAKPHKGGHIYFAPNTFDAYASSGSLSDLPAVYAVADGVVGNVSTYFAQSTGNYRYGLLLDIATLNGDTVNLNYSIEPFLDPDDEDFYKTFLLVEQGDAVSKGDVIAYMYSLSTSSSANCTGEDCSPSSQNAHIHFELNGGGNKMSPSIFDSTVMGALHMVMEIVGDRHNDCTTGTSCDDLDYQACGQSGGMGFQLSAEENPFADAAVECL
ncbi:MAG: hypothetical protein QGI45_13250 [Myxococcota bacterium]|nr:hypothetical protein [Myxococcota bacterium]